MKRACPITAIAIFLVVGCVQLAASTAGLKAWLEISSTLAFFLSLFVAWTPLIGTLLGFLGAVGVWGWPWLKAGIFFFGSLAVVLTLGGLAYREERRPMRRD